MIVPMDETSIRRIVAGQAVTDMASAIKELVDNALDAGATTINSECDCSDAPESTLTSVYSLHAAATAMDFIDFLYCT